MKDNRQRNLTKILFIIYIVILVWILLFKMSFSINEIYKSRSINLIPFRASVIVNGKIDISEIINNIVVFIPVGIYVCMLKKDWSILNKISVGFFISLGIEVLQFILAIVAISASILIILFVLFLNTFENK